MIKPTEGFEVVPHNGGYSVLYKVKMNDQIEVYEYNEASGINHSIALKVAEAIEYLNNVHIRVNGVPGKYVDVTNTEIWTKIWPSV